MNLAVIGSANQNESWDFLEIDLQKHSTSSLSKDCLTHVDCRRKAVKNARRFIFSNMFHAESKPTRASTAPTLLQKFSYSPKVWFVLIQWHLLIHKLKMLMPRPAHLFLSHHGENVSAWKLRQQFQKYSLMRPPCNGKLVSFFLS